MLSQAQSFFDDDESSDDEENAQLVGWCWGIEYLFFLLVFWYFCFSNTRNGVIRASLLITKRSVKYREFFENRTWGSKYVRYGSKTYFFLKSTKTTLQWYLTIFRFSRTVWRSIKVKRNRFVEIWMVVWEWREWVEGLTRTTMVSRTHPPSSYTMTAGFLTIMLQINSEHEVHYQQIIFNFFRQTKCLQT